MPRISMIACLAFLLPCNIFAQVTLQGKVADERTKSEVGYVTISLLKKEDSSLVKGQVSDSAGAFSLTNVAPGRYYVLATVLGYERKYTEFHILSSAQSNLGTIFLVPNTQQLGTVSVSGSRPTQSLQADKLTISVANNALYNTSMNAFDVLTKIPGITRGTDGALQISGRNTPTIFIDGKPLVLTPGEIEQYLSGLPPNSIQSIEVIAQPSARYDGEYKGIIDIKLKRDATLGLQGTANIYLQQNAASFAEGYTSLTYKTPKFVYTGRIGYTLGTTLYRYNAYQQLANTNWMSTTNNVSYHNNNLNFLVGTEYTINKNHQVEFSWRRNNTDRETGARSMLSTTNAAKTTLLDVSHSFNLALPQNTNNTFNLNYTGHIGQTNIQFLGNRMQATSKQTEDFQHYNDFTKALLTQWKTKLQNDISITSAQVDVNRPLFQGTLRFGGRYAANITKNDLRYDTLNVEKNFVVDSGRTNRFNYNEYVHAGYVSYERKLGKLQYSVGLRVENTQSAANAITTKNITERNFTRLLPSISLSYQLQAQQQVSFSYAARMTRPVFAQLNPFRFYNSPLNFFVGNPYLQPSTTHTINLSYAVKSWFVSMNIGKEFDVMGRYPLYDTVTNELQYLGKNFPYTEFITIETSVPLRVTKWWRMQHNLQLNYKKEKFPYLDQVYAIPNYDFRLNGTQVFTLPKSFTFELRYLYQSPYGNSLYRMQQYSSIDVAVSKSFLDNKLMVKLNYYDIFDNYQVTLTFREQQIINNRLTHYNANRRAGISIVYNFGKSTLKAKQRVRTEEENRIGF
ncbi:TonB-dependent receptor-like protein [Chitinophaga skermanii]|uniref:TonB-dependent receptor-like protein n=1 Tax=Chitinophaga skermanii TaxID=331697 RepID=A0A327R5K2_9BACT|nr:outer membrane beta-barrel protein [Chitinophaga skermanii]RAJ10873.1 TonB-dependent receptor-like protein [Chitinophaga skermanii]